MFITFLNSINPINGLIISIKRFINDNLPLNSDMKNIVFVAHTLDDKIVKDGISAISDNSDFILKGGMAVQAYFNKKFGNRSNSLKRETSDIDTCSTNKYSFKEFKDIANNIENDLLNKGYCTDVNKNHNTYEIEVVKLDEGDKILMHLDRYANGFYNKEKQNLERIAENSKKLNLFGRKVNVVSPEDILASKINRLICHKQKYGISPRKIDLGQLIKEKEMIEKSRSDFYLDYRNISPTRLASLRSDKDVYDIILLDMSTNLDAQNLYNALLFWDIPNKLKDKEIRKEIISVTPEIVKELLKSQ